jgi:hypothetical protein
MAKLYPVTRPGDRGGRPKIVGYRYAFKDHEGIRRFRRLPIIDRDAAQQIADREQAECLLLKRGVVRLAERITVAAVRLRYADARAALVQNGELRESTHLADEELWARYGRHFDPLKLSDLNQQTLAQRLTSIRSVDRRGGRVAAPLSPSTKLQLEKYLTKLVHWAQLHGFYGADDAGDWSKPWKRARLGIKKPTARKWRDPDPAQLGKLFREAHAQGGAQLRLVLLIQLGGGHRRGELSHMRWGAHLYQHERRWRLHVDGDATKTGGVQASTFAGRLAEVVDAWHAEHRARWPDSPWVFPVTKDIRRRAIMVRRAGDQRSTYVLSDARWRSLCEAVGLVCVVRDRVTSELVEERWRVHDLRRAFARVLSSRGKSLQFIQGMMGHGTRAQTQTYIEGPAHADELEVSETWEQLLFVDHAAAQGDDGDELPEGWR